MGWGAKKYIPFVGDFDAKDFLGLLQYMRDGVLSKYFKSSYQKVPIVFAKDLWAYINPSELDKKMDGKLHDLEEKKEEKNQDSSEIDNEVFFYAQETQEELEDDETFKEAKDGSLTKDNLVLIVENYLKGEKLNSSLELDDLTKLENFLKGFNKKDLEYYLAHKDEAAAAITFFDRFIAFFQALLGEASNRVTSRETHETLKNLETDSDWQQVISQKKGKEIQAHTKE